MGLAPRGWGVLASAHLEGHPMKIAKNSAVTLDYTLKNDAGKVLDESGGEPLTYLHGNGQLVPGLERELEGKAAGAKLKVVVAAKDGYGEKKTGKTIDVPIEQFEGAGHLHEGMPVHAVGDQGEETTLWVMKVTKKQVVLGLDHPLAGETLHFEVEVRGVRAATAEELSHGHVHGPGDHHHH